MSISSLTGYLEKAKKIMVFTGAGVSTDSGINDYRGPTGLWKTRQPVMYQDFMASEEARVEYWDQKTESYDEFKAALPNATHLAIAKLERTFVLEMLVTQNIDGLHERAGVSRSKLVELHGTNNRVECQTCGKEADLEGSYRVFKESRQCPVCDCGGYLKQATISFGQGLRQDDFNRALVATEQCDLVIALGSSLSVYPAAEFPLIAARRGAPYLIINRGPTEHDGMDLVTLRLEGDVGSIFPKAVDEVF